MINRNLTFPNTGISCPSKSRKNSIADSWWLTTDFHKSVCNFRYPEEPPKKVVNFDDLLLYTFDTKKLELNPVIQYWNHPVHIVFFNFSGFRAVVFIPHI